MSVPRITPTTIADMQATATLVNVLPIAGHIVPPNRIRPRCQSISLGGIMAKRSITPKRQSASRSSISPSASAKRTRPGVTKPGIVSVGFLLQVVGQEALVDDLAPVQIVLQRANDLLRAHHLVHGLEIDLVTAPVASAGLVMDVLPI